MDQNNLLSVYLQQKEENDALWLIYRDKHNELLKIQGQMESCLNREITQMSINIFGSVYHIERQEPIYVGNNFCLVYSEDGCCKYKIFYQLTSKGAYINDKTVHRVKIEYQEHVPELLVDKLIHFVLLCSRYYRYILERPGDIDMCIRLIQQGYKRIITRSSVLFILHHRQYLSCSNCEFCKLDKNVVLLICKVAYTESVKELFSSWYTTSNYN